MKSFNSIMNYFSFKVTEVKSYKHDWKCMTDFFNMFYLKIHHLLAKSAKMNKNFIYY